MTFSHPSLSLKGMLDQMHGHDTLTHDLSAAVIAGQFAGLAMAFVLMALFPLFLEESPLFPVQLIGTLVFGEEGLQGLHLPALFTGLILHQLGPSLFWALVFGMCIYAFKVEGVAMLLPLGLTIGIVSQVVDSYVLVPAAYQMLQGVDLWSRELPPLWSWLAHIVYGLCLGIYPLVDEKLSRT